MPFADDTLTPLLPSMRRLQRLRNFDGTADAFWPHYLDTLIGLSGAAAGVISQRENNGAWQTVVAAPENAIERQNILLEMLPKAAPECQQNGFFASVNKQGSLIAIALFTNADLSTHLALLSFDFLDETELKLRTHALLAHNDLAAQFRLRNSVRQALDRVDNFKKILDLAAVVNTRKRFLAAAMTVCNELAVRCGCDRVSLGWYKGGKVKLKAMSCCDHFAKKMEAVIILETAMEEALDQDADIILPPPVDTFVTRDHEAYAKDQSTPFMATLPLRSGDESVALLSFERATVPFDLAEVRRIRVTIDHLTPRLVDLHDRDRWFGPRMLDWIRRTGSRLVGPEHTLAKLIALIGALAFLVIALLPVDYRVDAPMILRTEDVTSVTAPFDGYIDAVGVRPGELVTAGTPLLELDNKDLLLEEASLLAERNREQREVEKARAMGELAEMCIAQARYDQADAKLAIVRHRLKRAVIAAPYDGVVVDGDLRERIGAPVRQGELLFTVSRIRDLYAEAKVHEAEIQNIASRSGGEIALASRPGEPFPISVSLIEPAAEVADKENVFLVHGAFGDPLPSWCRPGMTGVAKIEAGKKTLLWIAAHRAVDYVRLKLWW